MPLPFIIQFFLVSLIFIPSFFKQFKVFNTSSDFSKLVAVD